MSLNQNWGSHKDPPDEAKISGAANESSMQKHVNSFKTGKTRVTDLRLVRVLNKFLRKGASSLDQSQSEDQRLLGATHGMSWLVGTLSHDLFPIAHAYYKMTGKV